MASEVLLTTETAHETPAPDVLGKLGIRGSQFIGHLINFSIILVVMWLFVYKPLMKKMDEREKKIRDGLAFSKEAARLREDAERERQEMIRKARADVRAELDEARTKTEEYREEQMARTKAELEKMNEEARARIASERKQAYDALKADIADLVTRAASRVVEHADDKQHRSMVEKAIKEVEQA